MASFSVQVAHVDVSPLSPIASPHDPRAEHDILGMAKVGNVILGLIGSEQISWAGNSLDLGLGSQASSLPLTACRGSPQYLTVERVTDDELLYPIHIVDHRGHSHPTTCRSNNHLLSFQAKPPVGPQHCRPLSTRRKNSAYALAMTLHVKQRASLVPAPSPCWTNLDTAEDHYT